MSEITSRKMNPEVKEKWLAWLRDPANTQTIGCLKDDKGYCCLGGLTDIYIKEQELSWVLNQGEDDDDDTTYGLPEMGHGELECGVLPSFVMNWAGLDSQNPSVMFEGYKESISNLNDDYKQTFAEIADIIEEQL